MKKKPNPKTQQAFFPICKLATLCEEVAAHLQLLFMQATGQNLIPAHQTVTTISNIQAHLQLCNPLTPSKYVFSTLISIHGAASGSKLQWNMME